MMSTFFTRRTGGKAAFLGAALLILSLIVKIYAINNYGDLLGVDTSSITALLFYGGMTVGAASLFIFTAAYLEIFGVDKEKEVSDLKRDYQGFRDDLSRLAKAFGEIPPQRNDEQLKFYVREIFESDVRQNVKDRLEANVGEIAQEEIVKKFAPEIYKQRSLEVISDICDQAVLGMQERIEKQELTARVGLLYGVGFALAGLAALAIFVFQPIFASTFRGNTPENIGNWNSFLINFLPRLSFVLIFESIAFFFLKTYRDDKAMVRYFRNEITNVEAKFFAMISAVLFADKDAVKDSVAAMMKTERNFLIKKGDRTVNEAISQGDELLIEKVVDRLLTIGKSKLNSDSSSAVADPKK